LTERHNLQELVKKMAPRKKKSTPKIDPNSSFTPENFEKELKELAKKAKEETWSKALMEQATVYARSLPLLGLIAISANVSLLSLSPVFGAIPAAIRHPQVVMAACFLGWSCNLYLRRLLPFKPVLLLPLLAVYAPMAQSYLFALSGPLTARWGPAVVESLTLLPLMVVAVAAVASHLDGADFSRLPGWLGDSLPGLGSWAVFKTVERLSMPHLEAHMGKSFFQTRMGLHAVLAASYALAAPSKLLLWAIPGLFHFAVLNTHVASPTALNRLNGSLLADDWMIIDRKESLTGYVSVVESKKDHFRAMRCDHSLLGGEWVHYRADPVAEPIYGVFVMLEAIRLVEVAEKVPDSEAKALVM
jgi:hypothetical protein